MVARDRIGGRGAILQVAHEQVAGTARERPGVRPAVDSAGPQTRSAGPDNVARAPLPAALRPFRQVKPKRMSGSACKRAAEEEEMPQPKASCMPPVGAGLLTNNNPFFVAQHVQWAQAIGVDIGIDATKIMQQRLPSKIGAKDRLWITAKKVDEVRVALGHERVICPKPVVPVGILCFPA